MRAACVFAMGVGVLFLPAMLLAEAIPPARIDPDLPAYAAKTALSGEIRCAGGNTMQALVVEWGRLFQMHHPRATVGVRKDTSLAAEGFDALLAGSANCATFVREPFPAEIAAFTQKFGYPPLLVNVAGGSYATPGGTHAIAIYVNAANPLGRLTLPELDAIFSTTRRRGAAQEINRWGQLGLGGEWADRPIHVYTMLRQRDTANPPGIMNYLAQRVLQGGEFRADVREQRDAPGETALAAIVNRVAADPSGIGFSGIAFAVPGVKRIALAERAGGRYFAGDVGEVARRDYPLSRRIYVLLNRVPDQPMVPVVREFLTLVLSREGQQAVAKDHMQFLPLSAADAAAARIAID